jgi:phosphoribulokinase
VVTPEVNIARYPDLLIGVVPVINLEWIQKLYRDKNVRGYSAEAVTDTILRRMPDYVNYICPQFSTRTSTSSACRWWTPATRSSRATSPAPTRAWCVIRFANPKGIDFPYLLNMIDDSG